MNRSMIIGKSNVLRGLHNIKALTPTEHKECSGTGIYLKKTPPNPPKSIFKYFVTRYSQDNKDKIEKRT